MIVPAVAIRLMRTAERAYRLIALVHSHGVERQGGPFDVIHHAGRDVEQNSIAVHEICDITGKAE